jgi:hypothetical protein
MGKIISQRPTTKAEGEAGEIIDAMGHENEKKGIKWTQYFMDKWEKKEWEENQLKKDRLGKHRMKKKEYTRILYKMFEEMIKHMERPAPGYFVKSGFSHKGIWSRMYDKYNRTYARGVKVCGTPKVDFQAIVTLAAATEDKMWEVDSKKETPSGIYLP